VALIDTTYTVPPTLSTANVKINGNLHAGVGLGLTGNSTFTQGITKRVVRTTLFRSSSQH
jgi:hypothetical protein